MLMWVKVFFFQPQESAAGSQKTRSLGDNSIFNEQAWQLEMVWRWVIWRIQLRAFSILHCDPFQQGYLKLFHVLHLICLALALHWVERQVLAVHHDGESHQIAFMLVAFTLVTPDLNNSPVCSHLGIQSNQFFVLKGLSWSVTLHQKGFSWTRWKIMFGDKFML